MHRRPGSGRRRLFTQRAAVTPPAANLTLTLAVALALVVLAALGIRAWMRTQAQRDQPPLPMVVQVGQWPEIELPAELARRIQALVTGLRPAEGGAGIQGAVSVRCGPPGQTELLLLSAGGVHFREISRQGQAAAPIWRSVLGLMYDGPRISVYAQTAEQVEVVPLDDPASGQFSSPLIQAELSGRLTSFTPAAPGVAPAAASTPYPNYLLRLERGGTSVEMVWQGALIEVYARLPGGGALLVQQLHDTGNQLWLYLASAVPATPPSQRDGLVRLFAYDHLTALGGPVAAQIQVNRPLLDEVVRVLTWAERVGDAGVLPETPGEDEAPVVLEFTGGGTQSPSVGGQPAGLIPAVVEVHENGLVYAGGFYFREGLQQEILALMAAGG
jgi:hypothetical protein